MFSNPSRLVYGTIAVGAVLAAESARNETYAETVGAVLITLLLYWLAHSYALSTARRLDGDQTHTLTLFGHAMVEEVDIVFGAALPLLAVLLSWTAGASLATAVAAGIWTSVGEILAIEVVAAVRTERSGLDLVAQSALGLLLGLLILSIKLVLH